VLALFFILASIPTAVFLAKQRQEVRKQATGGARLYCKRWSGDLPVGWATAGGYPSKINYCTQASGGAWVVSYRCDYRQAIQEAGGDVTKLNCDESDYDNGRTLAKEARQVATGFIECTHAEYAGPQDFIDPNYYGGKCQVVQTDVTNCTATSVDYPTVWGDGDDKVAFVIAYNGDCPTPTVTPTISVTPIVTPTLTVTLTPTITRTITPTVTPRATPTVTPRATPTVTPRATPTVTPRATPTVTPTITPTQVPLACVSLTGGTNPESKKAGETLPLTCRGTRGTGSPINHFEFQVSINNGALIPQPTAAAQSSTPAGSYTGTINYVIPTPGYGCYNFECRACTSTNSTQCTTWGRAI
jgi:hypothetical protein